MTCVVWGIPSCGTVKKARAFLDAHGIAHVFKDLRAEPPSLATVQAWVTAFGARALRNTSGGSYRALPVEKDTWTDAQWTRAFVADPMLIKRPVIEQEGRPRAVGGRDDALRALIRDA